MELLVVFLHNESHLNDLLSMLVELDVQCMAQVESESLMQALAAEVPIFAGLRQLFQEERTPSRTIFAVLESPDAFGRLRKLCAELRIDFGSPEVGCMFTVPVGQYWA